MSKKVKIFLGVCVLIFICVPIYLQVSKSELTDYAIGHEIIKNYNIDTYSFNVSENGVLHIIVAKDEDKKGRTIQETCNILDTFRKHYKLDNINTITIEKLSEDKKIENWTISVSTSTVKNNKWMEFKDAKQLEQKLNMKFKDY